MTPTFVPPEPAAETTSSVPSSWHERQQCDDPGAERVGARARFLRCVRCARRVNRGGLCRNGGRVLCVLGVHGGAAELFPRRRPAVRAAGAMGSAATRGVPRPRQRQQTRAREECSGAGSSTGSSSHDGGSSWRSDSAVATEPSDPSSDATAALGAHGARGGWEAHRSRRHRPRPAWLPGSRSARAPRWCARSSRGYPTTASAVNRAGRDTILLVRRSRCRRSPCNYPR